MEPAETAMMTKEGPDQLKAYFSLPPGKWELREDGLVLRLPSGAVEIDLPYHWRLDITAPLKVVLEIPLAKT